MQFWCERNSLCLHVKWMKVFQIFKQALLVGKWFEVLIGIFLTPPQEMAENIRGSSNPLGRGPAHLVSRDISGNCGKTHKLKIVWSSQVGKRSLVDFQFLLDLWGPSERNLLSFAYFSICYIKLWNYFCFSWTVHEHVTNIEFYNLGKYVLNSLVQAQDLFSDWNSCFPWLIHSDHPKNKNKIR